MFKDIKAESWYREQRYRWAALEGYGWQFGQPPHRVDCAGIIMFRDDSHAVAFYVPLSNARTAHATLLELCERHHQSTVVMSK